MTVVVLSTVQLKIEETSRRLRSGDLGIPGLEDRLANIFKLINQSK
jgi:hypothetical protein